MTGEPAPFALPCAFCGTPANAPRCPTCQRDPRAARRICRSCQRQTPTSEPSCMHCQVTAGSDLSWKIPVIILMFVAAIVISVAIRM